MVDKKFAELINQSVDPDIIIASCSAFNIEGYRVGYGGGFFARTISELGEKKNIKTLLYTIHTMQYKKY